MNGTLKNPTHTLTRMTSFIGDLLVSFNLTVIANGESIALLFVLQNELFSKFLSMFSPTYVFAIRLDGRTQTHCISCGSIGLLMMQSKALSLWRHVLSTPTNKHKTTMTFVPTSPKVAPAFRLRPSNKKLLLYFSFRSLASLASLPLFFCLTRKPHASWSQKMPIFLAQSKIFAFSRKN